MPADVNVTEKVARAEAERRYASPAHYGRAEIRAFIAGALWHRARGADFGPAPVVPDSPDVLGRAMAESMLDAHLATIDDLGHTVAVDAEGEPVECVDECPACAADGIREALERLAAVGQGVTTEPNGPYSGPTMDLIEQGHDMSLAPHYPGPGQWCEACPTPAPAVVRSGEQDDTTTTEEER